MLEHSFTKTDFALFFYIIITILRAWDASYYAEPAGRHAQLTTDAYRDVSHDTYFVTATFSCHGPLTQDKNRNSEEG